MRGILSICAALLVVYCATAAAEPLPGQFRGSTRALEQIAPSTASYINVITTTSASDDSCYFGFYPSWISITPLTADVTVSFFQDTDLRALAAEDTLQYASGAGAAGTVPRIDPSEVTIPVGSSLIVDWRVSACRVQGEGSGSCIVLAGGSPLRGGN